jgi:hypothetical protein
MENLQTTNLLSKKKKTDQQTDMLAVHGLEEQRVNFQLWENSYLIQLGINLWDSFTNMKSYNTITHSLHTWLNFNVRIWLSEIYII